MVVNKKKFNSLMKLMTCLTMMGCATNQDYAVQEDVPKPDEVSAEVHVHQTSGLDVVSELDRDVWMQTRKSTDKDQMRLYSSLGLREWDVAIGDARHYLKTHPGDFVALSVLSTALAMKQNYNLASYYAKLIDKLYPGQAESKNIMGLAILHRPGANYQDIQKAAKNFEAAFTSDEKQIASGLNLGHLHLQSGNAQSAKQVFEIVRRRCQDCTASLYGLGLAASRLKEFPFAKKTFEDILQRDPSNNQAKYYLALVENFGFNKPQEAVSILTEMLDSRKDGQSQDVDVLRQANFLKRRIEAQIYAQNYKSLPQQQKLLDQEGFTIANSADEEDESEADQGREDLPDIVPVGDGSEDDYNLEN